MAKAMSTPGEISAPDTALLYAKADLAHRNVIRAESVAIPGGGRHDWDDPGNMAVEAWNMRLEELKMIQVKSDQSN